MANEFVAGVSFSDDAAQIAVLRLGSGGITAVHLEEYKNDRKGQTWFLQGLLLNRKEFRKVSKVSVALDSAAVFQHSFPMDASLTPQEQNDHLHWELANFIGGFNPKELVNDARILRPKIGENRTDVFAVSARRAFLRQIQNALDEQKYELNIVDTNHFAGQYALLVNYPEVRTQDILLASAGDQRLDIGIVRQGQLGTFRYFTGTPEERANRMLDFCREEGGQEIYLYGSGCGFALMKTLQGNGSLKLTKMNPFRRVSLTTALREAGMVIGREHKFVASVGIALRKE